MFTGLCKHFGEWMFMSFIEMLNVTFFLHIFDSILLFLHFSISSFVRLSSLQKKIRKKCVFLSNNSWSFYKQWHSMKWLNVWMCLFFGTCYSSVSHRIVHILWLFKVVICMQFLELNTQTNTMNWSHGSFYASNSTKKNETSLLLFY